jgi:hypothetical protein
VINSLAGAGSIPGCGTSGCDDGDGIDIYIISGTSGRKPVDGSEEEVEELRAIPRAGATPMRVSNQNGYPHDQIIINSAGTNPFFAAAPAINTFLNFHQMRLPNGDILLDFAGNLDVFPDHELIITPYGGKRTTVQCWKTTRSGPISLAEPPTQQIRGPIIVSGNNVITGPDAQKRVPMIGK